MTLTLPPEYLPARFLAAAASTSTAVSRATFCRSHSVAAPGPGPISSMSAPRSACCVRDGKTSSWRRTDHSELGHNCAWFSSIALTLRTALTGPKGVGCHPVSQDGQSAAGEPDQAAAVMVVTFPMPAGLVFDWHTHPDHQLAWGASGVLTVRTAAAAWVLPQPGRCGSRPAAARDPVGGPRPHAGAVRQAGPLPDQLAGLHAGGGQPAAR